MSAPRRLIVLGAAGQAREMEWLIRAIDAAGDPMTCAGFVVSDLEALSPRDSAERVLGDFDWLVRNRRSFDGLVLGIGSPVARLRVASALESEFDVSWWPALVHPANPLDRSSSRIAAGVAVCAGSVLTVGVQMEAFSMANFGCTIGHEAVIGRGSVVNPGASISGGVRIGEGVLVGTGARVLQYLEVGEGAVVGAGAVVTRPVAPRVTVVGIPARERL